MLSKDDKGNLSITYDSGMSTKLDTEYKLNELKVGRPVTKPITTTQKHRNSLVTHTKHKLTYREARFIDVYMETGDKKVAVKEAGFKVKNLNTKANNLLDLPYIADEIAYRTQLYHNQSIADRDEILRYFTSVMRGEIKDQFGLDAPLGERTNAAKELAKRIIDVQDKDNDDKFVTIKLDWNREAPLEGEFTVVDDNK